MKHILEIQNIGKKFNITHKGSSSSTFREALLGFFKRDEVSSEIFWALKDVNFNVYPGESIGIMGKNGAGKSTLLKILSKITPPSTGKILSRGRIASLLEVGTGFHSELTGRENVYLNGSILGLRRAEINKHFDAIVDFSGVERFLDTPLKHYSSGMQLRLAFAVAAHLEPEILIIDEVLAVGDVEFQKKCMRKMSEVSGSGRTILFVSHDMNAIASLCSRGIVLKNGTVDFTGGISECIENYLQVKADHTVYKTNNKANNTVYIRSIQVSNSLDVGTSVFFYTEEINLTFEIEIIDKSIKCDLFFLILDSKKRRVFAGESSTISSRMTFKIEKEFLVRGRYSVHAFINQPNIARLHEIEDVCEFEIIDSGSLMQKHGDYNYGNVFGRGTWL
jgi:lipopolysaccharide transport system ATP-binding protein